MMPAQGSGPVAPMPVGLCPRKVWVDLRVREILQAIGRYSDAGKAVPPEWIDELKDHVL